MVRAIKVDDIPIEEETEEKEENTIEVSAEFDGEIDFIDDSVVFDADTITWTATVSANSNWVTNMVFLTTAVYGEAPEIKEEPKEDVKTYFPIIPGKRLIDV